MMSTLSYTLGQLAAHVGAEVRGDADLPIQGGDLAGGRTGSAELPGQPAVSQVPARKPCRRRPADGCRRRRFAGTALVVANPLAYASLSHLFDRKPKAAAGIHPTAIVAADAEVDPSASVGAYAVIGVAPASALASASARTA